MEVHDKDHEAECPRIGSIEPGTPSSWGPVQNGVPNPGAVNTDPVPAKPFTAKEVPCLRGPCAFYFSAVSHFDIGNPAGTFDEGYHPTQNHHQCTAVAGVYIELSADSPIYECSHWRPLLKRELEVKEKLYEEFYKERPEFRPEIKDDVEIDEEDDDAASTD